MLALMVVEAALSAGTTWLVIKAGRDVANDRFVLSDLGWMLAVQSTSYIVGAVSWMFAERAGFGAFGRYMHRFARSNRHQATVLGERSTREKVEPFLTGESFHIYFELMYEMESALRLLLALVFNSIVLGLEIDGGLPVAYAAILVICLGLQYAMRKRTTHAYAQNQKHTNRMTAHTYTAWDNIFSGNRYNYRLWNSAFKARLRQALSAQVHAIMVRESLSTAGGIISLMVVFGTIAWVAVAAQGDTETLIALAATLPRQIDLAHSVLSLSEGTNDLLSIWTRMGGAVDHFQPAPDNAFNQRVRMERLSLHARADLNHDVTPSVTPGVTPDMVAPQALAVGSPAEVLAAIRALPTGRIQVRGGNGSGKSSLLAVLKKELGAQAYYWPTTDRLAFGFAMDANAQKERDDLVRDSVQADRDGALSDASGDDTVDADDAEAERATPQKLGFSAGEWQIKTLQEIVDCTDAQVYLLDEWDANLDAHNRARAAVLMGQLAARARVVEISHRDADVKLH